LVEHVIELLQTITAGTDKLIPRDLFQRSADTPLEHMFDYRLTCDYIRRHE